MFSLPERTTTGFSQRCGVLPLPHLNLIVYEVDFQGYHRSQLHYNLKQVLPRLHVSHGTQSIPHVVTRKNDLRFEKASKDDLQAVRQLFLVGLVLGLLWEAPVSSPGWLQDPSKLLQLLRPASVFAMLAWCSWDALIMLVRLWMPCIVVAFFV